MKAWNLDTPTLLWFAWILWFLGLEFWAVFEGYTQHTLTEHLRPLFQANPLLWFLAVGLWSWLGVHFVFPSLEEALIRYLQR